MASSAATDLRFTNDICYTMDASHFLTCGEDGDIHIYKTTSNEVYDIDCSCSCYRFIVAQDGRIYVSTSENEVQLHTFPQNAAPRSIHCFNQPISAMFLSDPYLFIGTKDCYVVGIDINDNSKPAKIYAGHKGSILDVN